MLPRSVDNNGDEIPAQYETDAQTRLFTLPQFHGAAFPLAIQALTNAEARRKLVEVDARPDTTEEGERMRTMLFDDVWSRAVLNSYHARLALRIVATEVPEHRDSKRGQAELQFWRVRIAALDDVLLGLALARQTIAAETRAGLATHLLSES